MINADRALRQHHEPVIYVNANGCVRNVHCEAEVKWRGIRAGKHHACFEHSGGHVVAIKKVEHGVVLSDRQCAAAGEEVGPVWR